MNWYILVLLISLIYIIGVFFILFLRGLTNDFGIDMRKEGEKDSLDTLTYTWIVSIPTIAIILLIGVIFISMHELFLFFIKVPRKAGEKMRQKVKES